MTVRDLWYHTTADIFIHREGAEPLKLPAGGDLKSSIASREILMIGVHKRASESPYLLVRLKGEPL